MIIMMLIIIVFRIRIEYDGNNIYVNIFCMKANMIIKVVNLDPLVISIGTGGLG